MKQIIVTHVNGVELAESKTKAIYEENIVWTKDVNGLGELMYASKLDRRVKPEILRTTNTKAVLDGFIAGSKTDFSVYDVVTGDEATLTIQDKYVKEIKEDKTVIANVLTACRSVQYVEGAFLTRTVYVSDTLDSLADAVVTTTTTTAPVTTTTTTP